MRDAAATIQSATADSTTQFAVVDNVRSDGEEHESMASRQLSEDIPVTQKMLSAVSGSILTSLLGIMKALHRFYHMANTYQ